MAKSFDLLGNIVIVNFNEGVSSKQKKKFAQKVLDENKSVRTVLEKVGKVKGRLRKAQTKFLLGEKTKEVRYKENGCVFRFNVDKTYFSPRLSNDRKEVSKLIKKNERVLVMFAGVGPYSIVIAKNSNARKVVSNEINRIANSYARKNAVLNKVSEKIVFWDGDAKRISKKKKGEKFDFIVMARPNLKDTFLSSALSFCKRGTRIYYHGFCNVEEAKRLVQDLKEEAKKIGRNIKVIRTKKIGEIAPYKIRLGIYFRVTS